MSSFESWGRYPDPGQQDLARVCDPDSAAAILANWASQGRRGLPRGQGRSYGDSCLAPPGGALLTLEGWNRVLEFDASAGWIRVEASATFFELVPVLLSRGWWFPVTPGTKFVSIGGAVANDIHGKNHHSAGSFGNHVRAFELLRSDGTREICSEDDPAESERGRRFRATIGGLGLTGVILWVEFRLKSVPGGYIDQEVIRFEGMDRFLQLSAESEPGFEYSVAWVDALTSGDGLKGHFIRGNHSHDSRMPNVRGPGWCRIPRGFPGWFLNRWTIRAFNSLYYHRQRVPVRKNRVGPDPFFYPLDAIQSWNRIYGRSGFLQYQFVVPGGLSGIDSVNRILLKIRSSGEGSFLSVLKVFGQIPSRGLLSFSRPGITLALDFKNTGKPLFRLLEELDELVLVAGGAIYPAKDARMSRPVLEASFPRFQEYLKCLDPALESRFSERLGFRK